MATKPTLPQCLEHINGRTIEWLENPAESLEDAMQTVEDTLAALTDYKPFSFTGQLQELGKRLSEVAESDEDNRAAAVSAHFNLALFLTKSADQAPSEYLDGSAREFLSYLTNLIEWSFYDELPGAKGALTMLRLYTDACGKSREYLDEYTSLPAEERTVPRIAVVLAAALADSDSLALLDAISAIVSPEEGVTTETVSEHLYKWGCGYAGQASSADAVQVGLDLCDISWRVAAKLANLANTPLTESTAKAIQTCLKQERLTVAILEHYCETQGFAEQLAEELLSMAE